MALLAQQAGVRSGARLPARRRTRRFTWAVLVTDAVVLAATVVLGHRGRELVDRTEILDVRLVESLPQFSLFNALTPVLFVVWLGCLVATGAYESRFFGGGTEEFRRVATATGLAAGGICTVAFFMDSKLSRGYLLISFAVGMLLLVTGRYLLRKVLHRLRATGRMGERVLAVCGPDALHEVVDTLERLSWSGYRVVGVCLPERHLDEGADLPVPVMGCTTGVVDACREADADVVLVAGGGHESSDALRRIGWELEGQDVELVVVPALVEVAGPRIQMRQAGGLPLVHVDPPAAGRANGWPKRAFDLVVTSVVLALLAVPMLLIALLVKAYDGGPVLYRQERRGRGDRSFEMWKFRSMVVDADRRTDDLEVLNDADEVLFKIHDDPRVTWVGRWLRRVSVDELPQLVNVLRGEMSLVGPRPPLPSEVEDYPLDMHRRLLVRPGLTGLWQVSGRSDLPFEEAVRMDLYYVDNWSITGDVIIMLKTARAVVTGSGAY